MKKLIIASLLLAFSVGAQAGMVVTITDLNDTSTEGFNDAGSPGIVFIDSSASSILGTYWQSIGGVSISNEAFVGIDGAALLGTSIFGLNAKETGTNVGISVLADFDLGVTGPGAIATQANAATLTDASVTFATGYNGSPVALAEFTNTGQNYAELIDVVLTSPFILQQSFVLTADAIGADIGFDVSTQASVVPIPAAAWLFGSALAGLVGVGRLRKTTEV